MARKALTEEEKLKVINENLADFSKDKSQEKLIVSMQKTLINVILLFLVLSERTTIPPLKQRK